MAIICREHKLLFIMVPGTGCSVVGNVLQDELGGVFFPEQPVREDGRILVQRKHNTLSEILEHGLMTPEEREDYLVFATIRNPFDRWVTYYQRYAGNWIDYYEGVARRGIERDRKAFDLSNKAARRRHDQLDKQYRKMKRRRRILGAIGFNMWMKGTLLRWYWKGSKQSLTNPLHAFAFPMLEGVDIVMRQEQLEEGLNEIIDRVEVSRRIQLPRKNRTPGKKSYTEYWSRTTRWLVETLLGKEMARFGYSYDGLESKKAVVVLSDRNPIKTL